MPATPTRDRRRKTEHDPRALDRVFAPPYYEDLRDRLLDEVDPDTLVYATTDPGLRNVPSKRPRPKRVAPPRYRSRPVATADLQPGDVVLMRYEAHEQAGSQRAVDRRRVEKMANGTVRSVDPLILDTPDGAVHIDRRTAVLLKRVAREGAAS